MRKFLWKPTSPWKTKQPAFPKILISGNRNVRNHLKRFYRWKNRASFRDGFSSGGILDAACDSIVVLVAMLVMGSADPFCLGAAFIIVLSMFTWVFRCLKEYRFSYSRFGRYNGAVCYAFMTIAGFISLSFPSYPWRITILESVTFGFLLIQLGLSSLENIIALLRVRSRSGFSF